MEVNCGSAIWAQKKFVNLESRKAFHSLALVVETKYVKNELIVLLKKFPLVKSLQLIAIL